VALLVAFAASAYGLTPLQSGLLDARSQGMGETETAMVLSGARARMVFSGNPAAIAGLPALAVVLGIGADSWMRQGELQVAGGRRTRDLRFALGLRGASGQLFSDPYFRPWHDPYVPLVLDGGFGGAGSFAPIRSSGARVSVGGALRRTGAAPGSDSQTEQDYLRLRWLADLGAGLQVGEMEVGVALMNLQIWNCGDFAGDGVPGRSSVPDAMFCTEGPEVRGGITGHHDLLGSMRGTVVLEARYGQTENQFGAGTEVLHQPTRVALRGGAVQDMPVDLVLYERAGDDMPPRRRVSAGAGWSWRGVRIDWSWIGPRDARHVVTIGVARPEGLDRP
jgi:hypothetical protein